MVKAAVPGEQGGGRRKSEAEKELPDSVRSCLAVTNRRVEKSETAGAMRGRRAPAPEPGPEAAGR